MQCGYCESQHNYRGGPRIDPVPKDGVAEIGTLPIDRADSQSGAQPVILSANAKGSPRPWLSPTDPMIWNSCSVASFARRPGITPVAPAQKWRGGTLVLRPATPGLQEKTWPIETFFNKVVMLRNRLRNLEQQVNASDLPDDVKLKLQGYVSGCYGSLTSFNLLFANEEDHFKGTSSD